MSKTGASPEFERKMQEIAAKTAHMVIPRSKVQTPLTEPRFPAWTEDTEQSQVIPAEAVEALAAVLAQEALVSADMDGHGWDAENDDPAPFMPHARERARTYLEAAAPYIAGTWHDAVSEAYVEGALSLEQASVMWAKNPHRTPDAR